MSIEQLMILFILIEMFQVFFILVQLIATRRQLNQIMEDPAYAGLIFSNAIHGFIGELVSDEDKQKNFFGLMQIIGQNIMAGATGGGPAGKPVKLKGWAKVLEPFVNNPQVQGVVAQKLGETLSNAGKKGVEKAVDNVLTWQ